LTWVLSFFLLLGSFWWLVGVTLTLELKVDWWLGLVLIKVEYVDFDVESVELGFEGLEVAVDEMSHLLVNHIFWVNNIKNFIKRPNLFIMLLTGNLISINHIINLSRTNVL